MTSLILGYAAILTPTLILLVGCAIAGYLTLARVGRGVAGILLGFFLGPIGLLIAWPMRANALLDRAQREQRERVDGVSQTRSSETRMPVRSLSRDLDELVDQRARGQISAEEYERRKSELLG
jgi:hypothetical protein